MTAAAPTLWKSINGRRSLLYLIAPRSPRYFTRAQIDILAETDATKAQTSKKDDSVRAAEIRKAASESLLEFVANHGKEAAMHTAGSLLVAEIMLQADGGTCFQSFRLSPRPLPIRMTPSAGQQLTISHSPMLYTDQAAATKTLLELIASPYPAPTTPPHPMDASHVERLYKTLLQGGHYDRSSKSITKPSSFSPSAFASSFLAALGRDVIVAMARGGRAFVVAGLCRRVSTEGTDEERMLLRTWFTEKGVSMDIRAKEMKGKDVLLGSINALLSA